MLSVFPFKETIYPKICSKSRLRSAKNSLPVVVRRSKTSSLPVLLKIMTKKWNLFTSHEGNFQHHFVCLFFARRLYQNCARVSHVMAQYISMEPPHYCEYTQRVSVVTFSYADYSKRNSNRHTAWPVPNASPILKPYFIRVLADLSRPRGVLIRIFCKSMYYFFRVHILFIRSDLGAAIMEGVKKRAGK